VNKKQLYIIYIEVRLGVFPNLTSILSQRSYIYNKDNVILLVNKVKNKAVTRNQLATAQVLNKVQAEVRNLDTRTYQAKIYLSNVVPKIHSLDKELNYLWSELQ